MNSLTKAKINLKRLLTKPKNLKSLMVGFIFVILAISFSTILITLIIYLIPILINGENESITIAEFVIIGSVEFFLNFRNIAMLENIIFPQSF